MYLPEVPSPSPRMDKRRICDGSEELRQLKERLHMAKVNKAAADGLKILWLNNSNGLIVD